ncbi:hypothetical protein [Imbroritus primus]|uniref:hypothetical protein n=1 Tax=Imbroritus primus TaxID=3058603 RepID=UPI003D1607E8
MAEVNNGGAGGAGGAGGTGTASGTGFITDLIKNYGAFADKSHGARDTFLKAAAENGDDTKSTLELLNNQQTESRVTGIYVNVVSKQDEMMRKSIDAMRG